MKPALRKIWILSLIVQISVGLTIGAFEATGGAYFFDCLKNHMGMSSALLLTTGLLSFRHGLIALLEVPAGALADSIGRVKVVVMGFVLRAIFFVALAALGFSGNLSLAIFWGIIASLFWPFSYTFYTGVFTAWCIDRLGEDAPDVSYAWLVSRIQSYNLGSAPIGTAIGILFYIFNAPAYAYLIFALVCVISVIFCVLWMKEPKKLKYITYSELSISNLTARVKKVIGRGMTICKKKTVLFWLILTFGAYMALMNLVMFLWPIYFKEHLAIENNGYRWLILAVIMVSLRGISARFLVHINNRWESRRGASTYRAGFRGVMFWTSIVSAVCILILGWFVFAGWHSVIMMAIAVTAVCVGFGFILTTYETLINVYIPKENAQERATIISAGSMFRSVLAMLMAIPSGGTTSENTPIFWAIPALLLVISAVGAFISMKREDKNELVRSEGRLILDSAST